MKKSMMFILCMIVCVAVLRGTEVKAEVYDIPIDNTAEVKAEVGDVLYFYYSQDRMAECIWQGGSILREEMLEGSYTVVAEGACGVDCCVAGRIITCAVYTSGATQAQKDSVCVYESFSRKNPVVAIGQKLAIRLPGNISPKSTVFTVSNEKILQTVDCNEGIVKGKKAGKTIVTATNSCGQKWRGTVRVSGAVFEKKSKRLEPKQKYALKIKGIAAARMNTVTYTSSNKKVATVSSKGIVKAKKVGKAVITASVDGVRLTFKANVKNPVLKTKKIKVSYDRYEKIVVEGAGSIKYIVQKKHKKKVKITKTGIVLSKDTGLFYIKVKTCSMTFKVKIDTNGHYTTNILKMRKRFYKEAKPDRKMLEYVNAERKKQGLKPLKWYSGWEKACRQRVADNYFLYGHERPYPFNKDINILYDKAGIKDNMSLSGENLTSDAGYDAFINFMESKGHYDVMMLDLEDGYFCCADAGNTCIMAIGEKAKSYIGDDRKALIAGKYDYAR